MTKTSLLSQSESTPNANTVSADVNVVDSFKATAWDYARIRKLHYCQLIIMSHQRQRMSSNPNSPLPNGFGLLIREDSAGMHDDFSRMVCYFCLMFFMCLSCK